MPPSTRIPPLLQPYLQLPHEDSLLLVTSTLGASANWLLVRLLATALGHSVQDGEVGEGHNVVFVSWMRELEFWKQESRKGVGLDLERFRGENRLVFVDGLTELCLDAIGNGHDKDFQKTQALPVRASPGRAMPARGPAQLAPSLLPTASMSNSLKSLDLAHIKTVLLNAVSSLNKSMQRRTLIILDNPDMLLALNPSLTPSAWTSFVLELHRHPCVSHVLTHIQADSSLSGANVPPQPLEIAHHNLLVKCAHISRRILGIRVLDTGVARDVSGVIRITEQMVDWLNLGLDDESGKIDVDGGKGKEFLYQVKGDGSVKVFERGAGGDG